MDIKSDNAITLFDICWEDVLFEKLVPMLSLKDLFTLRCCSKTSKEFVDRSFQFRTQINFDIYDSITLKRPLDILAKNCKKIKYLNLSEAAGASHTTFAARFHAFIIHDFLNGLFINNKNLEYINFTRCCLDYPDIMHLIVQECKELKVLKLSKCMYTTGGVPEPLTISHSALEELEISHCRSLKESYLLTLFQKLSNIKKLSLSFTYTVTDNVIINIGKYLKSLTHIDVYGCDKITIAGYESLIKNCANLKAIDMSGTISLSVLSLVRRRALETGGERIRLRRCHYMHNSSLTRQVLS